jgi:hypothetical protein
VTQVQFGSINLSGCWERGRPVRTEREARKTLVVFDIGNNVNRTNADETSAFPALSGLVHPGWTFGQGRTDGIRHTTKWFDRNGNLYRSLRPCRHQSCRVFDPVATAPGADLMTPDGN